MAKMYTKTQVAKLAGVTKEAVRQWALNNKIRQDSRYRLYVGDPKVEDYISRNKLKNRIAVTPKNKPYKNAPKPARTLEKKSQPDKGLQDVPPPDKLTAREERLLRNQELKLEAELRKTLASAKNLEFKNLEKRGDLGDIKFLSSIFYQQLHYAIRQFLILPNSTMDDVIALAMEKGESARVDCVNLQNERINQIGEITVSGWEKNLRTIETKLLRMEIENDGDS